jgi:2-polyprenyl-6-methoxyphenol hydroxylase-like FAD-dependent oxidoreductase
MNADVVIAGGGPVGMLLACELRLADVRTVVLEQLPRAAGHSRAFRLQTRTLELLDQRGLLGRFEEGNLTWPKAHFAGIQPLLDLSQLPSAHPYALLIPQARSEALLEQRARELGAEIRRGHQVTGVRAGEDDVQVQVRGPADEYALSCGYLVGCDGGRSSVRKLAGIGFPGTGGSATALLGDVHLTRPEELPIGVPGTLRTATGLLMAVSLEAGVTRVLTTEFGRTAADRGSAVTLEELRESVRRVTGADVQMDSPRWLSRFSDATCLADDYRRGRILLAGDAAHVHFPIGAQGLNLGLQDAMNLGWKLAAEVCGWAPPTLLDTFQRERRPAAERVLRETRSQLALMNPDERVDPLRALFGELLAIPAVNRYLSEIVTGLDVRYQDPAAADACHPLVGDRAPELTVVTDAGSVRVAELLHRGRGVLLDLDGDNALRDIAAGWARRIDLVTARCTDGEPPAAALLIRPDGYVAWVRPSGAPVQPQAIRDALASWFGAPA